jgi:hypothetical protein
VRNADADFFDTLDDRAIKNPLSFGLHEQYDISCYIHLIFKRQVRTNHFQILY